jgi:Icc-related predicted phosphoesterase
MRLWIFSDLHLEAHPEAEAFLAFPEADVAVCAGDIHRPMWQSIQWLADHIAPHMPVIFVPGNHEFYGGAHAGCMKRGRTAAASVDGVCLLNDDVVYLGDVRFIGSTLWTDYALGAEPTSGRQRDLDIAHAMNTAGSRLMDHTAIALEDDMLERWQPEHALAAHRRSRTFIHSALCKGHVGPTVVVTHHAPHPGSIDRQYEGSPINPAFASDLSEIILDCQPEMWVHGHVHHSTAYTVGETCIVCNPRGYGDENPSWDAGMVVTVPRR